MLDVSTFTEYKHVTMSASHEKKRTERLNARLGACEAFELLRGAGQGGSHTASQIVQRPNSALSHLNLRERGDTEHVTVIVSRWPEQAIGLIQYSKELIRDETVTKNVLSETTAASKTRHAAKEVERTNLPVRFGGKAKPTPPPPHSKKGPASPPAGSSRGRALCHPRHPHTSIPATRTPALSRAMRSSRGHDMMRIKRDRSCTYWREPLQTDRLRRTVANRMQ